MEQRELINKLFSWSHEISLQGYDNTNLITVYQRLVGDLDIQKARMSALRYSREMRSKLRDETSEEYIVYVSPIDELDRDALTTLILIDSVNTVKSEVEQNFYFPEPKEPSAETGTTEEFEEYAHKWEIWEQDRALELNKLLVAGMDKLRKSLDEENDASLANRAKQIRIRAVCDQELKTKFLEMCAWLGTYADKDFKVRLFPTFIEFLAQHESSKSQLMNGYAELEMSTISLKESTKSQSSEVKSA